MNTEARQEAARYVATGLAAILRHNAGICRLQREHLLSLAARSRNQGDADAEALLTDVQLSLMHTTDAAFMHHNHADPVSAHRVPMPDAF